MNITSHLNYDILREKCNDLSCISAGLSIKTMFEDIDLRCGCEYRKCVIDGAIEVENDEG